MRLTVGAAIKVERSFVMASLVAPHPVIPLSKIQFSGSLFSNSGICATHLAVVEAVIILVSI